VGVVCCKVEVSATDLSLVQRNPTDCGASLCLIKKLRKRGGYSPLLDCENTTTVGCKARKTNKKANFLLSNTPEEHRSQLQYGSVKLSDLILNENRKMKILLHGFKYVFVTRIFIKCVYQTGL
jgi:hypothetical protein